MQQLQAARLKEEATHLCPVQERTVLVSDLALRTSMNLRKEVPTHSLLSSKDCQVQHWRKHKPQCDHLKKFVKAAARDANVDTFATEQVMHTFGDDGKVATSYHREGSIAPDGGCYFVTKDGEKVQIDESTGVTGLLCSLTPKVRESSRRFRGTPRQRKP